MKRTNGFTVVEGVIGAAVLVIIGLLAYTYWNQSHKTEPAASQQTEQPAVAAPGTIDSTDDLDQAEKALNATDLDSADLDQAAKDASL